VREHIKDGRVHSACAECVVHRSFELHRAAMNPIRQELQVDEFAPPPALPPPPVLVEAQVEDRGIGDC
jgi:hypothetical protein